MSARWRFASVAFVCLLGGAASSQVSEAASATPPSTRVPEALESIKVIEHLGEAIPGELEFTAEDGSVVKLSECFDPEKPVLLVLSYYRCPMLCGLVFQGLTRALKAIPQTAGREFDVVVVSIDSQENAALASAKKAAFLKDYGRAAVAEGAAGAPGVSETPGASGAANAGGIRFLTGTDSAIHALASAVGFGFRYEPERKDFAHPAVLHILGPGGVISRYLYGIEYEPRTLRLSIAEAARGETRSDADHLLLYCFQFDPQTGKYVFIARNIMRIAGGITGLFVILWLGGFWLTEWRRIRRNRVAEAHT
jgi:protein SCO1/2